MKYYHQWRHFGGAVVVEAELFGPKIVFVVGIVVVVVASLVSSFWVSSVMLLE